jgi:hypothetical protein
MKMLIGIVVFSVILPFGIIAVLTLQKVAEIINALQGVL